MKSIIGFLSLTIGVSLATGCQTQQSSEIYSKAAIETSAPMPRDKVQIYSGSIDAQARQIVLEIGHSAGCGDHSYELDIGACAESYPLQCRGIELIHRTSNRCEAFVVKEIRISFEEAGLDSSYYSGASLTINGSSDTSVSLRMPESAPQPTLFSSAVDILDGHLDNESLEIVLEVGHSAGCGTTHEFFLEVGNCAETFPVMCSSELKHRTDNTCEAYAFREVRISLEEAGLSDPYYRGASLTIRGNNESEVTLNLP